MSLLGVVVVLLVGVLRLCNVLILCIMEFEEVIVDGKGGFVDIDIVAYYFEFCDYVTSLNGEGYVFNE